MNKDQFFALGNEEHCDPDTKKGLIYLVNAVFCFERAEGSGISSAYNDSYELAEKAIEYLPSSAIAHFISAMAKLKGSGDLIFTKEKYHVLLKLEPESSSEFLSILKHEIERVR